MTVKGFIFDLDGVIVDTAKYHFLAWKKLAESIGITFSEEENEQLKGVSRVRSLEKILEWGGKTLSTQQFDTLITKKNNDYLAHVSGMDDSEILPDVLRVLHYLENQNQLLALGSASKNAKPILEKVNLLHRFKTIVDGTNVTLAKPNPEVFLKAAQNLNVSAKNCIVFEDSLAGIQAANTAGMLSIGIGNASILKEANYVFPDFTHISNSFLNQLIHSK